MILDDHYIHCNVVRSCQNCGELSKPQTLQTLRNTEKLRHQEPEARLDYRVAPIGLFVLGSAMIWLCLGALSPWGAKGLYIATMKITYTLWNSKFILDDCSDYTSGGVPEAFPACSMWELGAQFVFILAEGIHEEL